MANKKNKQSTQKKDISFELSVIMGVFALVVLCIFPLVYHNFYFDILETKYQFYCVVAIAMMVIVAGYGLWTGALLEYCKNVKIKEVVKKLNLTDWAMIAFWFAHVMSWILCSDFHWEAFWGTSGRYNGVFLITIYMVVYFMVTRLFVLRKWYLDAFLAISIFVCLFGISDYFKMDLLGFKVNMYEGQKRSYTSTFGNINTYAVYVDGVVCISIILFAQAKKLKDLVWYFVVMVISMVAIIMGTSDSSYLALAALFGFAPLYLLKSKTGTRRYLTSVATFLTAVLFVGWISKIYAGKVYRIAGIFKLLLAFDFLPLVTGVLWILVLAWAFMAYKKKEDKNEDMPKLLLYLWMFVIVAVVAMVVFVFYDANIAGNAERYGAVSRYVVFNDDWGSSRGWAWIRTMELYNHVLTIPQKIFGYGADTLQLLMMQYYPPRGNVVFDSVHNEYLHFLITVGFVGMMGYIVFLVSSIAQMAKTMEGRPEVKAIMFAIIAFAVQAVVNINLPVVMPLVLQLLVMGLARGPEETDPHQ